MSMPANNTLPPLDALRALLGDDNVITDAAELSFYSTDVYRRAAIDAEMVIRPGNAGELAEAVRICTGAGLVVIARGGGLSYTGGYLPVRGQSVIIDTLRMARVIEINRTDMYVTVECGLTWKALLAQLAPLGLRTPYFGPMSGYGSTVGGALSQGSVFLGSTQYGTTADSVLSVDVVLADGTLLSTGSAGATHRPSPFFRNYGPDLTGLFLHDSGALGIKASATLRLITAPEHSGAISFTFGTAADLITVMSEVSRRGLAAECFGADPYIWGMRLWDDDIGRDLTRLIGVARSGNSVIGGLKDAARIAMTGRKALKDVEYAMNVTVDGHTPGEVDHAVAEIRRIGAARGKEIEATVPLAVRGAPFLPPNDILGPKGERWAPNHGIAPHSRAVDIAERLQAFFDERAALMKSHDIEWGYVTFAVSTSAILIEPMLYWPGAREVYHERMIQPAHLAKLPKLAPDPATAEVVKTLRSDLTRFWTEQGCVHLQIGKTYHYLESRQPDMRALIEAIKQVVDPQGLINPGALGLNP